jgi:hypothetical protein
MNRNIQEARVIRSFGKIRVFDRVRSYHDGRILSILCLFICVSSVFWRYLLVWPTPLIFPNSELGTDLAREVWPLARFVVDYVRENGALPLWRPYLLSGAPLIGHPVAPVLYPPYWLIFIFPLALGLNLFIVLHLWWSAVGVYIWLYDHVAVRGVSAIFGALVFSLSPRWIAYVGGGHWSMIAAISWWSWSWLGYSGYRRSRQWRWAILLASSLAAQALTDGRILAINILWLSFWTIGSVKGQHNKLNWLKETVIQWGAVILIAFGLAAAQLFPFFQLIKFSTRNTLTLNEVTYGSLHPLSLLGLFFPSILPFPEWVIYPGVVALLFVLFGLRARRGSGIELKWVIVAVLGFALSLGEYTPLYGWLFKWIPGFSLFRVPARWWIIPLFGLTYFATRGFDMWQSRTSQRDSIRSFLAIWLLFLSIAVIKGLGFIDFPFEVLFAAGALTVFMALILIGKPGWSAYAVIGLFVVDVWWTSSSLLIPQNEQILTESDKVMQFLRAPARRGERSFAPYTGIGANALVNYGLRAADGYDSFQIGAYSELVRRAIGCAFQGYAVTVPPMQSNPRAEMECSNFRPNLRLLKLLNIRFVILPASVRDQAMHLVLFNKNRWVYDIGPGMEKAFGVSRWIVASQANCIDALEKVNTEIEAIVEKELPVGTGGPNLSILSRMEIPDGEAFEVRADIPSLMVRSETWTPGWIALVDGKKVDVMRVDCALQGVWIEAGHHNVRFVYTPTGYLVGRWVSFATVLALISFAGVGRIRGRRSLD